MSRGDGEMEDDEDVRDAEDDAWMTPGYRPVRCGRPVPGPAISMHRFYPVYGAWWSRSRAVLPVALSCLRVYLVESL